MKIYRLYCKFAKQNIQNTKVRPYFGLFEEIQQKVLQIYPIALILISLLLSYTAEFSAVGHHG
jgi:hypothetical protein